MKKLFLSMLTFLCCCSLLVAPVHAVNTASTTISTHRTDFQDGSYIIEVVTLDDPTIQSRATYSTSGSKLATYYNSSDTAIFGVKVTGTFTYTGSTSKATNSVATVYIYDSSATYVSKSASYSGNTAYATGKAKYNYVTIPVSTSLSCDKNGNLS